MRYRWFPCALCCTLLWPPAWALTPSKPIHSGQHVGLAAETLNPVKPVHSGPQLGTVPEANGLLGVHAQRRQTPTTVEHQSWFSRLQDSITQFVIGWILIIFSFPLLWVNESRNAKMETLLSRGQTQCRTASGSTASKENRNWLVHLQGEPMRSAAPVSDSQFDVTLKSDCVRLRRSVEVFQYVEHQKKEEKEKVGGGKDTITTYSYTTEWSSFWHDSSGYHDRSNHNSRPEGLDLGSHSAECGRVEYGEAFLLSEGLVLQCCDFAPAEPRLGDSVRLRGGATFTKREDGLFYYPKDGNSSRSDAKVGDARVRFEYVADGPASVLALQVDRQGEARDSFLPYRLISRGICGGMEEEDEKRALRSAAELSAADLAAQSQLGSGCLWVCCCACNLVSMCFSALLTPEIHHLFQGDKSSGQCFGIVRSRMRALVWGLRLVGWLMLFWGLYMLFAPFLTLIKVLPFLGPILAKLGGWLIWFMCFVLTLAVASVIICLAYLFYHPLIALAYSAVASAIIVIPLVLIHALS